MRKTAVLFVFIFYVLSALAIPLQKNYPHWNFKDNDAYQQLVKIDNFINANKGKGYVAAFDWDGTLYSEKISFNDQGTISYFPGDAVFFIWSAKHVNDPRYSNLFPMFHTKDKEQAKEIMAHMNYLENRSALKVSGYNLFSQLAIFEANMTPEELDQDVDGYLKDYPAKDYVFLPMLDIVQYMVDSGFKVWVITGGNPYFVTAVINNIQNTINYTPTRKYNFGIASLPYDPKTCHLVGNMAKLMKNGRFSMVYDDRFEINKEHQLMIVDGKGKYIAIKNYIEPQAKTPAVFYAGNSGGDYWGMKYIITKKREKTLGLAVNPYGTLQALIKQHPNKIVVVKQQAKLAE